MKKILFLLLVFIVTNEVMSQTTITTGTTRIQAESYSAISGASVSTDSHDTEESTTTPFIGGMATGRYTDYSVNVSTAGTYKVIFRISSGDGGRFQLKSGSTVLYTVEVPNTGYFSNWIRDTSTNITLSAGSQTLRIAGALPGYCNLNWMEFKYQSGGGNTAPTANAGSDQTITLPTNSVSLTGTGTDSDGTIASYAWTQIDGTTATIGNPSAATTNITGLTTAGTRRFKLTVTDNGGATGVDTVSVIVNAASGGSSQWITADTNIYYNTGNVGIGITNPSVRLAVNGDIFAKKVKVTQSGWADYVFEKTYKLPTLAEVEQFIQAHKHLPEIPSANDVEKTGLNLGDNQVLLLRKIEELTLYIIELNKKLAGQEKKIEQLQSTSKP